MYYLWFKWLHIVAIICWMAGLLYIIRLFIYHRENSKNPDNHKLLSVMERKLYKIITVPSMILAWFAGLSMIISNSILMKGKWLHWKLTFVILLTVITFWCGTVIKKFTQEQFTYSSKTLRIINEIPTIVLMIVVWLVVFRPF